MNVRWVETRRGVRCRVLEAGGGAPLVFLHGAGGLLADNPFLDALAARYHVLAPELPGYGESTGDERLEEMLDFSLHGWDVVDTLALDRRPHLVGHSMGGMIAAEMACLAPRDVDALVLVAAAGLWLDAHPIPDLFALPLHEFPAHLFADAARGVALLTAGVRMDDPEALREFYIAHSRRLATAGKLLFPIPNRGLARRLYRLRARTLVVWGAEDRMIPPVYAQRWTSLVPGARAEVIDGAGHMLPYEQPDAFVRAVTTFLA